MKPPRLPLLLLAPLAVAGGACEQLIDIRVQAQQLCVAAPSETFEPALPSTAPFPTATPIRMSFDKPLAQVPGAAADVDLDVRFDTVIVRSAADLAFIKKMVIALEPGVPDASLPPLPLGEYVRGTGVQAGVREINVASTLQSNVWKYLLGAPAKLRFLVTGKVPADSFTADIEACVYVQGQVTKP
jgi:hypothetical protein